MNNLEDDYFKGAVDKFRSYTKMFDDDKELIAAGISTEDAKKIQNMINDFSDITLKIKGVKILTDLELIFLLTMYSFMGGPECLKELKTKMYEFIFIDPMKDLMNIIKKSKTEKNPETKDTQNLTGVIDEKTGKRLTIEELLALGDN